MMKIFPLALSLLLSALPAAAIELSLEENRAERGNIGYIDMHRVFQLFPETQRAKEAFEETVRQTEEQVNLRKAELLRLRAELSQIKTDREVLAAAPPSLPPSPPPPPPPPPPAAPQAPAAAASPAAEPVLAALPGFSAASSAPVHQQPLAVELPGGATAPALVNEPALTAPPPAQAAAAPAPAPTALQLIDERIAQKAAEIARKESEYKQQLASAEKNLLDLESRKSEVLLGKIYKAVQEVSRKEGVSVVVDKGAILYGHSAVDLTDKVLKHLKGA